MIRGVNKNIIEISDTGNQYFERVILFVRPDSAKQDREHLCRSAGEFLSGLRLPRFYLRGRLWPTMLGLGGAAAAGALVSAFLLR